MAYTGRFMFVVLEQGSDAGHHGTLHLGIVTASDDENLCTVSEKLIAAFGEEYAHLHRESKTLVRLDRSRYP